MPLLRPFASRSRRGFDPEGIADLAERQRGVVSRHQLLDAGVGEATITRWTARSHLHRIHPGVYALGHAALSLEGRLHAALLYGGDQAVLSHTTAAWAWSLVETEPTRIHLTLPGRLRSLPGVRVHHSRQVEMEARRGFAMTPVARTLVDLASMVSPRQVRRALAEADYRGVLNPAEVQSVLRKGRRGSPSLRAALDGHLPQLAQTLSVLEERFLEACEIGGLPVPEVNARVGRMRVDALWRDRRLVVELDGSAAHGGWGAVSRDRERELALRQIGFRVVRYTWHQLTGRPGEVIDDLRRQLSLTAIR